MLLKYLPYIFKGYFILACLLTLCMVYEYDVNARRAKDDPEKRNFHFGAVIFIPWLWPLLILSSIVIVILQALMYILFLGLTLFLILVIRKPFLLVWLDKIATKVGNQLLEINNYLIKLMFGNLADAPQST
jgi:hypothetical protein